MVCQHEGGGERILGQSRGQLWVAIAQLSIEDRDAASVGGGLAVTDL